MEAKGGGQGGERVVARCLVEYRVNAAPGAQDLGAEQPQERALARDDRAAVWHEAGRLQHRLRRARRHHARKCPTWDRERSFLRTRCNDDAARLDESRAATDRNADIEIAIEAPHRRPM